MGVAIIVGDALVRNRKRTAERIQDQKDLSERGTSLQGEPHSKPDSGSKENPVGDVGVGYPAGERRARPILAVLPFDNVSRDAEVDGFCDGLAEDVITALSRFRWINIVSKHSSFAHKGRSIDIRQVARDLNVCYVLEGSVRKSDHRLRITAQLIDGKSGNHVWAERYDRDYSVPFDLQDEITRDVVASLEYVL